MPESNSEYLMRHLASKLRGLVPNKTQGDIELPNQSGQRDPRLDGPTGMERMKQAAVRLALLQKIGAKR